MNEDDLQILVSSLTESLPPDAQISEVMLRKLLQLAFEKQHDSDRLVLVSGVKNILEQHGFGIEKE